jgi:hypothetical protein
MEKASALAFTSSKNIERSFNIMGAAITAATGTAVGALGFLIEKTEDTVFSMQRMAQQAGVSIEQFSKFASVAKSAGMPVDAMSSILTRVSHSAYEAANGSKQAASTYKAFGVSVIDANGHFKTADQIMLDLAKSSVQFRDSADKTGAEMTVMGRSGAQAAEFMKVLATRFDSISEKAEHLGVVFNSTTAVQSQKLHESFVDLEEAALGLSVRLLSQVSPALDSIVERIVAFVSNAENMRRVDQIGQDIAKGVTLAADAVEFLVQHFEEVKFVIESLVAIRMGGIFIPMIASAAGASGMFGKFGIATTNLVGNLLGIRRLGNLLGPLAAGARDYSLALGSLATTEGVAATGAYAFSESMSAAKAALLSTIGPAALAAGAFYEFALALKAAHEYSDVKDQTGASWWTIQKAEASEATESVANFYDYMKMVIGLASNTDETTFYSNVTHRLGAKNPYGLPTAKAPGLPDDYNPDTGKTGPASGKDFPALGGDKIDGLAVKLKELHDKAIAARDALMAVGMTPQAVRDVEITKKYALFLDEATKAKRKLTEAEKTQAHGDIAMEVNSIAATKYEQAMLDLSLTLASSTEEHEAMASAIGKSAQAMQDAAVKAKVNQEMLRMAGPGWEKDPTKVMDAYMTGTQVRGDINSSNRTDDAKSLNSAQLQIEAQQRLNQAILQGAEARRQSAITSEQAAIRADFADRKDTDVDAMERQIDLVRQKSNASNQAADLERASSLNALQRYQEQKQALIDAVAAAKQYGVAIDQRQVLAANKEAWIAFNEAQDKAILATGSAMDGLKVALDQMARDTESSAQRMYEAVNQMVSALNDSITKMLMNGHFNQNRNEIRKSFATDFKGVGSSLMKQGLQKGESAILGGLGIGGKPDGSSSKPFWVKMAGGGGSNGGSGLADVTHDALSGIGIGGGSGGFGGFMSKVLGFGKMALQGAFADGTDSLIPGVPALIGEKGPELFIPPSSGSILPNSALKNMGGGHNFYIDASNSQDPAQTKAMVMQAIAEAAPHITNNAANTVHERNLRVPTSSR